MTETEITLRALTNLPKLRDTIKSLVEEYEINLNGYLVWLAETQGPCLLANKAAKQENVALYKRVCTQEAQTLPRHIVNAGTIYSQLTSNDLGLEDALKHLGEMCLPVAVYMLFAGEGYDASRFKQKARDYCKKFPSAVDSLPEPYKEIGKALINDTA